MSHAGIDEVQASAARPRSRSGKLQDLQFIRGIAIFLVLCAHWMLTERISKALGFQNPGWVGVPLFFVLSGFVVTQSLVRGGFQVVPFMARRFFRLYPALLCFIAISLSLNHLVKAAMPSFAIVFWTEPGLLLRQCLSLLAWNFPDWYGKSFTNDVLWSLSVEFKFYAALALAVACAKLFTKRSDPLIAFTVAVAAATWLYSVATRVGLYFGGPFGKTIINDFEFMAVGVLAALLPASALSRLSDKMARIWPALLLVPLVVLGFSRSPLPPPSPSGDVLWGFVYPFVGLSFGLLIIAGVNGHVLARMPRILARFMCALGDRSYTIFLIHYPCFLMSWWINYLISPYIAGDDIPSQIMQLVTSSLIMIPLAELIYRGVELPMIRVGKRVIDSNLTGTVKTATAGHP